MKVKFTTTIDENVLKKMQHRAVEEGIYINELIEKMVNVYDIYIQANPKNDLKKKD